MPEAAGEVALIGPRPHIAQEWPKIGRRVLDLCAQILGVASPSVGGARRGVGKMDPKSEYRVAQIRPNGPCKARLQTECARAAAEPDVGVPNRSARDLLVRIRRVKWPVLIRIRRVKWCR